MELRISSEYWQVIDRSDFHGPSQLDRLISSETVVGVPPRKGAKPSACYIPSPCRTRIVDDTSEPPINYMPERTARGRNSDEEIVQSLQTFPGLIVLAFVHGVRPD
ncbi:hypothetical protein N7468_007254 [Penicillium chermesinum]|uniref:Uncharacterized protein n=1 Tax=Penicillium chermesinum TaxID=63820 RepID=A0A9W9NWN4_9EURO|nr:uncharacterized protein N7468_007254 [Penicillium chermesinum]KAJ5226029.1 hypothetical protein N7468_007254 [Penicillium chermesinum]KAJ6160775.1 hypothetical protein N7470_004171 [Penicillium chermesinum]